MLSTREESYFHYTHALENTDLSPTQRMLGVALARRFYITGNNAPSVEELGNAVGVKSLAIHRAKGALEEKGWITVTRRGLTLTNEYSCHIPQ